MCNVVHPNCRGATNNYVVTTSARILYMEF